MSDLDYDAIREKWLQQCGACDGGLPMACVCPTDDPRPVILDLAQRAEAAEAKALSVAEIVARIEDDPRYDDSFGAAGLFNLRDDLREALRVDQ